MINQNQNKISEEQKENIMKQKNYSDERFYKYRIYWSKVFPLLSEEEIEDLAWHSFLY